MRVDGFFAAWVMLAILGVYYLSPAPIWFQQQSDIYFMNKAIYAEQYKKINMTKELDAQNARLDEYSARINSLQTDLSAANDKLNSSWGGFNAFFAIMTFVWGFAIGVVLLRWFTDRDIGDKQREINTLEEKLAISEKRWADYAAPRRRK